MGEMAHVIGRKPGGPRSDSSAGTDDSYDNLILLCPNHHTMIDKAYSDFPAWKLRQWKTDWEEQVRQKFLPRMSVTEGTSLELRLWSYFNFDLILTLHEMRFHPRTSQSSLILDEKGFPLVGPDSRDNAETLFETWPQNLARQIQLHFSELVEEIIRSFQPIDLDTYWGIRKLDALLYPTAIAFVNRRCIFKSGTRQRKPEKREVRVKARSVDLRFQIDTWNIYSNSSLTLHYKGSSRVASLLFVRSVERERSKGKTSLIIKATPIALGTGFWPSHDRTPPIAYRDDLDYEDFDDASVPI